MVGGKPITTNMARMKVVQPVQQHLPQPPLPQRLLLQRQTLFRPATISICVNIMSVLNGEVARCVGDLVPSVFTASILDCMRAFREVGRLIFISLVVRQLKLN